MNRRWAMGVMAVVALLWLIVVAGAAAAGSVGAVKIGEKNEKYFFAPTTAYVNVGGTVTWTNGTDAQHTVTSDTGGELDSPTIDASKTFAHTFAATGTFSYHCSIHPYAVGKVVVLAAGATLPPTDTLPDVGGSQHSSALQFTVLLIGGATLILAGLFARHRRTSR